MCGLVGFFVGCDLSIACPRRLNCPQGRGYRSAFESWSDTASVRKVSRGTELDGSLKFPKKLIPIFSHPNVISLDEKRKGFLQESSLYRFLNFTHKLELMVVNAVTANIALGRYDAIFDENVRRDAHRIYVDEAYHALVSFDSMVGMKKFSEFKEDLTESTPVFLKKLRELSSSMSLNQRILFELISVVVSEMMITSTLKDASKSVDEDDYLSEILAEHAKDEARHHVFYRHIFFDLWSKLSDEMRRFFVDHLEVIVFAYTSVDEDELLRELKLVGLSDEVSRLVIDEVYTDKKVKEYAYSCARAVFNAVKEVADKNMIDDKEWCHV